MDRCNRTAIRSGGHKTTATRAGRKPVSGTEGRSGTVSCTGPQVQEGRFQNDPGPCPAGNTGRERYCHVGSCF